MYFRAEVGVAVLGTNVAEEVLIEFDLVVIKLDQL